MSEEASLDEFAQDKEEPAEHASAEEIEVGDLQQLDEFPIESWELVKLGKILSLEYGDNLPSDSRENGSVPVFGSNGQVDTHSEAAVNKSGIVLGRKGSIGEIEFSDRPFWPIDTTYYITDEETRQNLRFLYYLLQNIQLERLNAASAIPGLNRNDTYGLNVITPPLEEQRKIATVLYTVDQAIQKTGKIIEQRERVKTGLLQDLTERGIDTNGNLRPHPSEDPSLFEEKHDRTVPSDWQVERLAEIGEWVSGKTPKRSEQPFWGGAIPWITAKDMKTLYVTDSEENITEKSVEEGATVVSSESVFVLVRGMALAHTLPVVRPTREASFNQDVKAILPHKSINPDYLAYWLKAHSNKVLALVTSASHGTKRLATEAFGNLAIPVPPLDEQAAIVEHVQAMDELIAKEKSHTDRLERVKKGLMQDLLSGAVRTHEVDIDIPEAVLAHG